MNIEELFGLQKELMEMYAKNLKLGEKYYTVEYVDKRIMALKVEIAEFANEVAFFFKYWKQSHVMDKEKALEELADVMHFFLSVGISRKYTFVKEINPQPWNKVPVEHLFRYLFENNFDSSGKWKNGFEQLVCIGFKLGYTADEMVQSYKDKREKNFGRQKNGY